jgi:hypothetical protein
MKLPPFWTNSPAAWSRTLDGQFAISNVTAALDKYYLVVVAPLQEPAGHVEEHHDGGAVRALVSEAAWHPRCHQHTRPFPAGG